MAFLIGQCCVDQVMSDVVDDNELSGLNEIIQFTNVSTLTIQHNATRKARFGDALVITIEILGEDGKYRQTAVEIVPNSISNTTFYTINLGGTSSGRAILT